MEARKHEELIAGIYDAALDPGLWPDVLRRLKIALDARGSVLFLNRGPDLVLRIMDGFDPAVVERAAELQKQDEYLKRRRFAP